MIYYGGSLIQIQSFIYSNYLFTVAKFNEKQARGFGAAAHVTAIQSELHNTMADC